MIQTFNSKNFRNEHVGTQYMFLLPLIGILQIYFFGDRLTFADRFMYYIFINNAIVLFSYRFDISILMFSICNITMVAFAHEFKAFKRNNVLFNYFSLVLLTNNLCLVLLRSIPAKFLKSFTFGEFAIISQCATYYLINLIRFFLFQFNLARFPDIVRTINDSFCDTSYLSLLLFFIVASWFSDRHFSFLAYLIFFPGFLYINLYKVLSAEPIQWLLGVVFQNNLRIYLFMIWGTTLVLTGTFVFMHTFVSNQRTTTMTRKVFHFAISVVYLVGIKYDVPFLDFISKLVLFVFIFVEIVRLGNIPFIGPIIEQVFERFRDQQDVGILTLTHIYLLVGCSSSVWLTTAAGYNDKLLLSSGIITIGIGDSFASIGGYNFGKRKWPNSNKTYFGTFCAFISQVAAYFLLNYYYIGRFEMFPTGKLIALVCISLVSALYETFTRHIDNLILPLVNYVCLLILFAPPKINQLELLLKHYRE